MRIAIQPIRPRKNVLDYREYIEEIKDATEGAMDVIVEELEKVVADWDTDVGFKGTVRVSASAITAEIRPTGNVKVWRYVDEGTRAHIIRPRKARALSFQAGYRPRTTPRPSYGGPGTATGDDVVTRVVHHPGTEARRFTEKILAANKRMFQQAIQDAIREAAK